MTRLALWRTTREAFFTGILVVTPAIVSLVAVYYLFDFVTAMMPTLATWLLPTNLGDWLLAHPLVPRVIGLLLVLVVITVVGLLTRHFAGQLLLNRFELVMLRLPLIRPIYATVRQIANTISISKEELFRSVVLLEYPRRGIWVIGFLTAEAPPELSGYAGDDLAAVFLPTTPNPTSGFLLYLPRKELRPLKLSVAQAMRLIISGGVVRPDEASDTPPATNDTAPAQATTPREVAK